MKRAMVVVTLLGLTTQANADNRDTWRGVFAGSLTVMTGGLMLYVHGATKVNDAQDELCARGGYSHMPGCAPATSSLTYEELDRLNRKGEYGQNVANIGIVTTGAAAIVAGIAFYKGFVAKPKQESAVVITPTITRDGGGATLQLRW